MTNRSGNTAKHLSSEHYIFDDVIGADELLWIYHELLSTSAWRLTRSSLSGKTPSLRPFMSFPGLNIETRGDIHVDFLSGYFRSVVFRIRTLAKKNNGVILPPNIQRIHVGAKSSFSKTEFHVDSNEENVWTILGFLNPVWNAKDGGEFFLEDHKIEHNRQIPGYSSFEHIANDGVPREEREKLNSLRVAVNITLIDNETNDLLIGQPASALAHLQGARI